VPRLDLVGLARPDLGAAYEIEPGHDGWVVGDEPV